MGTFEVRRHSTAAPATVFAVLTDFAGYGRWIPLTTMSTDAGEPRTGWRFSGRTKAGPLAFDDPMTITRWDPPTGFDVTKTGRLLAGWASVRITADGAGSRIVWRENITVRPRPLGRLLSPLSDRANALMFGRALGLMLAEAEKRPG